MSILITSLRCGSHNDVDGFFKDTPGYMGQVSVELCLYNKSPKTIKYITFLFIPYNAVGDIVRCNISNKTEHGFVVTGPIKHGPTSYYVSEPLWHNSNIQSVKLTNIHIEYMDGTVEYIPGSKIQNNSCTMTPGCYIATAVYGSYDCPQVWTLRRYRDYTLAETWYGRTFIHIYYAISPTLVKWFGNTKWFKKMWQGKLDKIISRLQDKGIESTPYEDREW